MLLGAEEVKVVLDDVFAESSLREVARLEAIRGRAIVVAPCEPRRRPRAVDVALVRVHRRRIENHHFGRVRDPAAEEPAESVRALERSQRFVAGERILTVAPETEVDVAARA